MKQVIQAGLIHRGNVRKILEYFKIKYLETKNFGLSTFSFECTPEQWNQIVEHLPEPTNEY